MSFIIKIFRKNRNYEFSPEITKIVISVLQQNLNEDLFNKPTNYSGDPLFCNFRTRKSQKIRGPLQKRSPAVADFEL